MRLSGESCRIVRLRICAVEDSQGRDGMLQVRSRLSKSTMMDLLAEQHMAVLELHIFALSHMVVRVDL
jgi:hypothetical protein